jgi:predicted transcriptional regulator with HTH domain
MTKKKYGASDEEIIVDGASLSFQSEERRNVYLYLMLIYPAWVSVGEIARNIWSDRANVRGALKGDGNRYSKKLALATVGLVEYKKVVIGQYNVYLYRAKRKGSNM